MAEDEKNKFMVCMIEQEVEKCEPVAAEDVVEENDEDLDSKKDGCWAWLVCLSSFLIQVMVVGILHAYGVFYVEFINAFHISSSTAAWIGAGAYGITMALAPLSSLVINKFGHRVSAATGCLVCGAALWLSSFAQNVGHMFGSFMVLFAIGNCFAYTPCMTIAGDYFSQYVSIATGIMTAGTSTGTLVLNPIAQTLCDKLGWRIALRIFSANCLIGFVCSLTFVPLSKKKKTDIQRIRSSNAKAHMRSLQLWKNKVYILWIIAIALVMFGYYIPYVHLIAHAEQLGIPPARGSIIVMTLGAATATGRIAFGKIVSIGVLDHLRMDQLSMTVTGTAVMLLPLIKNFYGLLAYVLVLGLVDGCYVVLMPTLTAAFCGDDQRILGWGFLNLLASVTFTLGPPVAGWIRDATGTYDVAFHVAGVPIIMGAILLFFIPWAQRTSTKVDIRMMAATEDFRDVSVISVDALPSASSTAEVPPTRALSQMDQGTLCILPEDGAEIVTVHAGGSTMLFDLNSHRIRVYSTVNQAHQSNTDIGNHVRESLTRALVLMQEPRVQTSLSTLSLPQNHSAADGGKSSYSRSRHLMLTPIEGRASHAPRLSSGRLPVTSPRSVRFHIYNQTEQTKSAILAHTASSANAAEEERRGTHDTSSGLVTERVGTQLPTIREMTPHELEMIRAEIHEAATAANEAMDHDKGLQKESKESAQDLSGVAFKMSDVNVKKDKAHSSNA